MSTTVRIRAGVVGLALVAVTLAGATPAGAARAGSDGPSPALTARPAGPVTARFDGSKRATDTVPGLVANAVGDVTISSQGCTPDPVAFGGQTSCRYAVQNQTQTPTTVDLQASGDAEVAVVGSNLGGVVSGDTARAEDVPLPARSAGPIQVAPGSTFAGYYPLEMIPIGPQTITDDQVLNYTVQPYRWNGATHTSIGISANGYAVVGGADTAKDASAAPQDMPNAGRPNNVLAPFWTDLTPAGGGSLRVATVANSAQPPCERSYWFVAQWDMFEFGTTTKRKAQLWIQADDPECATDPVPAEMIYFTYDLTTMAAAPVRPFRIGAEDSTGTVGTVRPAGQLPTDNFVVTSSGAVEAAPVVTWDVVGEGRAAGTGTVAATVESSLIPGSSTVFTDVEVSPEDAPTVTDDPDDLTVTAGQQAVFTAAASGAASVRWEVSTDDGGTWADVPGATATTLALTTGGVDDGNRYRAVFASGSGVETTTAEAVLTVERIATTTAVVPSPAAPAVGQAVTFTATVTPAGPGTVQFTVDGTDLGDPVTVSGGTATSPPVDGLTAGDHDVTATYSGDADVAGSTGTTVVSVGKVASTTSVAVDPMAPIVGDEVSFTATVAPAAATGTVRFTVDGTALGGPVAVSGGTATSAELAGLERGTHVVVAQYSGTSTDAASTTGPVTFSVGRTATTTTVTADPPSPRQPAPVTATATVSPAPAGGTVQFRVDGTVAGAPVPVVGGTATTTIDSAALAIGDHVVTAAYSGADAFAPSDGTFSPLTVQKQIPTVTILAVRPDIVAVGDDVAVDLQVTPAPSSGTVQLSRDGDDVGPPLTLDADGRATGVWPDTPATASTFVAIFSGNTALEPAAASTTLPVYSAREAFVRRAFPVVLGRPADATGTAHFVGLLAAGVAPETVTNRMAASVEGRRRLVDLTYQRALGRGADTGGRDFWAGRLASGLTAEDLLATLMGMPEGYGNAGGTPGALARALFRVHLDRQPTSGELTYWRPRIAAADTSAGRHRTALGFGRVPEATRVAVVAAVATACPGTTVGSSALDTRWAATGRNPLRLAGSALALVCPPEGLTP